MKGKSITQNYLLNLVYQILIMIVPLITTPYVSRVLGAKGIGIYSYTYSVVTYFILFATLGTAIYAQREIAFFQNNKHNQSIVFFEIVIIRSCTSLVCGFLYLICVRNWGIPIIGVIQGLYIVGNVTDVSWFFQGLEEFGKTIRRNILVKLINVIFIFLFVRTSDDLIMYVFCLAFMPIIGNISLWLYLPSYLEKIPFTELNPWRHMKGTFQLFVPSVATQIYLVLDKTMIGIFTDTGAENGYYEQAEKIVKVCLMVITSLGTVMVPRMASIFANQEYEIIKFYMQKAYRFVWFLAIPIFSGLLLTADMIVPWFLGKGYENTIVLIQILSILIIAIGLNNVTGVQYLIPTKKQNIYTLTVAVGAIVNAILNIILIPHFYSIGAAIASVVAESVITIVQFIYVVCFEKIYGWKEIFKGIDKYLISDIVMVIVVGCIKHQFHCSFWETIALASVGGFVYISILLVLKDDFFLEVIKKIKYMFMHKKRWY